MNRSARTAQQRYEVGFRCPLVYPVVLNQIVGRDVPEPETWRRSGIRSALI
jgi:hypothetical protein